MTNHGETPISFRSGQETLSGILNLPQRANERPDFAVVFPPAGVRGRLGGTFQYPFYARQLAARGYPSLRFDPWGCGDSSGDVEVTEMRAWYGTVQSGAFVDNTLDALAELKRHVKAKHYVVWGICGGAITALLAAGRARDVDGVVALSLPPLLDSVEQSVETDDISAGDAKEYLVWAYGKKILSPKAWMRLLSGRSELDTIAKYGTAIARAQLEKLKRRVFSPAHQRERAKSDHPRFNPHFIEALDNVVDRGARVIFLYGHRDILHWNFREHFYDLFWQYNPNYERNCEIVSIQGCNHFFTLREWQQQAVDYTMPWLDRIR